MSKPDVIVLRRSFWSRGLSLLLLTAGVLFAFLGASLDMRAEPAGAAAIVSLGGLFGLLGALDVLGFMSCLRGFRADRHSETITLVGRWWRRQTFAFQAVAAVQVTWVMNPAHRNDEWQSRYFLTWETNLVLEDPPLERIPLARHWSRKRVLADAERLAGLLAVALVDHG